VVLSSAALAVVGSPLAASSAAATMHPKSYATKVAISDAAPAIHGKLHSRIAGCVNDRTVNLFFKRPGPDGKLGSDTSSSGGAWKVKVGSGGVAMPGHYYATVSRVTLSSDTACKAGKSKVLLIESGD
jgi:hypothetical protein